MRRMCLLVLLLQSTRSDDRQELVWGYRDSGVVAPQRPVPLNFDIEAGGMPVEEQNSVAPQFDAAVRAGDVAQVTAFLDAGYDFEGAAIGEVRRTGATPLMQSVASRRPRVLQALLERGADPEVRTLRALSPLAVAATCKQHDDSATTICEELIEILVRAGADVDGRTEDGWSPLFHAARARNVRLMEKLLSLGASETLRERYNDEDVFSGRRRTYLDHARRFSAADDEECRHGGVAARRACGAMRAWVAQRGEL